MRRATLIACALLALGVSVPAQVYVPGDVPTNDAIPRNHRVASIETVAVGSRARISPDGTQVCYDYRNPLTGYYDILIADYPAFNNQQSIYQNHPDMPTQRNRGACRWYPTGEYLVWNQEVQTHYLDDDASIGNPGVGLYAQIYAMNLDTRAITILTSNPIKLTLVDGIESFATFNPIFNSTGEDLCYTQRYQTGVQGEEGDWRVRCMDIAISSGTLVSSNEVTAYTPPNNYAALMSILETPTRFLMAQNDAGEDFDTMDIILYRLDTMTTIKITETNSNWEEGSTVTPGGRVIFMSDLGMHHSLDITAATQKEYFLVDGLVAGLPMERLTFFNLQPAPESVSASATQPTGRYKNAAMPEIQSDGLCLLGTVGENNGTVASPSVELHIEKICFTSPL